jgi:MFS family permease
LGINVAAVYIGLSLGPFLGGLLTQHFGWRSVFLVNIPLGLAVMVLIVWKMKGEWAEAQGEKFDITGSLFYSMTLVAVMFGLNLLPSISGFMLLLASLAGFLIFIKWEMKIESPVLDVRLFRDSKTFAFSNLAAFINYSATFAVSFLLSLYLQYIKKLSPQEAGLILVSQPIVMAIFSPFAGRLSDRLEPRVVASLGMGLNVAGLFLFTFLDKDTTIQYIVGCLICLGFGFALFSSPNTNAIMSSVERKFYGVSSGIVGTMRLTGQMLSMGIIALIFSVSLGRAQITPVYYAIFLESTNSAFIIFTVLCVFGIGASLARGKVR